MSNHLLYRITHIDNLKHIFQTGKICTQNHKLSDQNYISIGDNAIINRRKNRQIINDKKISDFVSFYFSYKSPMLYIIQHGFQGIEQRNPEDVVYLFATIEKIVENDYEYCFTDGQANARITIVYNSLNDLDKLDWK